MANSGVASVNWFAYSFAAVVKRHPEWSALPPPPPTKVDSTGNAWLILDYSFESSSERKVVKKNRKDIRVILLGRSGPLRQLYDSFDDAKFVRGPSYREAKAEALEHVSVSVQNCMSLFPIRIDKIVLQNNFHKKSNLWY